MVRRPSDNDGRAELVAGPDPDAELQLEIETTRRTEARGLLACGLALAAGAAHRRARGNDRRSAAVIADGQVLVIGKQWVVGPEQLARIGRVVDTGKEIGVVPHVRGQFEPAAGGAVD